MPLTSNLEISRYVDQELRSYKMLAAAHIFKGAFVGLQRSSGYVRPLQIGDAFVGIAYEEVDNTAGQSGDHSIRVFTQGDFRLAVTGALQMSIGRPVYVSADDTLTLTVTGGATYVGVCVDVPSSGIAIVRLQTFADSQVLRYAEVPLASSTSAATTNPILITHKPILILAAEVIFNTKPDQGLLDVGTGDTTPNQIVNGYNLATLTNNVRATLPLAGASVAKDLRMWARVGQAGSTAGIGGLLMLRYIELP